MSKRVGQRTTNDKPMTIGEALQWARQQLTDNPHGAVDCEHLLCHVLQCPPLRLITEPRQQLSAQQEQQFVSLLKQRQQGVPVAYLTGTRGFWSLELEVNQHSLIPRPDTELLVSLALEKISAAMRIADLGTGSGAIALALAVERKDIRILATDYSAQALQVAQSNARKNKLPVQFVRGQWLEAFQAESLDLIVSNPPYICADDPHLLRGDLRFEPLSALVAGDDGLDDIRQIVRQAAVVLKPEGWLMIEHGYEQSSAVQALFSQHSFTDIQPFQDYGQQDRVVIGRRHSGVM